MSSIRQTSTSNRTLGRAGGCAGLLLGMVFFLGAACNPPEGGPVRQSGRQKPSRNLSEIVSTIEENASRLDRALWSKSVRVTARIADRKGKEHVYSFDGSLLFRHPRSLNMSMRHGLGGNTVMQVGSNDGEYWAWIEPEIQQMWWGHHSNSGRDCVERISFRPEQMVAALGIGGLPTGDPNLSGPTLEAGKQYDIINYTSPSVGGDSYVSRQYYVDRRPPYQVRLIAALDHRGRKTMTAYLDDYKPTWNGGPVVPSGISIFWPEEGGKFTIKLNGVTGKSDGEISNSAFIRPQGDQLPARVRSNIVQIDAACN
ncbi:MAG: hypothetical protein KF841_04320 [Phycisphaerae bacterium]|nr:hypothetical protein [Phycisphaerae bacterium]